MDEIWFYLIAALLYFLTRGKKKKKPQQQTSKPQSSSKRPQQQKKETSFEDLLREVTEGRMEDEKREKERTYEEAAEYEERSPGSSRKTEPDYSKEGETRHFSDEESKRVYEESIKQAEGHEIDYSQSDPYKGGKLLKREPVKKKSALANEIRRDLQNKQSARKAIIYSEILSRRY